MMRGWHDTANVHPSSKNCYILFGCSSGRTVMQTLELKVTRTYVDTFSHLDEWKEVGKYEVIQSEQWDKVTDDMTEPTRFYYWVKVRPDLGVSDSEVMRALTDTFSHIGCHHSHDCCGCRSFYAREPELLSRDGEFEEWKVTVDSGRNY